jgi:hypothetical protein
MKHKRNSEVRASEKDALSKILRSEDYEEDVVFLERAYGWYDKHAWVTNRFSGTLKLTTEEIRRLPSRLRDRWKDNQKRMEDCYSYRRYGNIVRLYVDYDKCLQILKDIYFTDKRKCFERFGLPAYTLLDKWWAHSTRRQKIDRAFAVDYWMSPEYFLVNTKPEIAEELCKLGYNPYTEDYKLSLPPDAR